MKRTRRVTLAVLLVAAAVTMTPRSSSAATVTTSRLAGTDRYDTARVMAEAEFPNGVNSVVLANGSNFADALAGAYYAGFGSSACPQSAILLTASDSLPAPTQAAISTLHATRATVLGGTAAVSNAVVSQLQGMGLTVSRVGGATRYGTMLALDTACGPAAQKLAFVASGTNYPDALAAAGASYGKHLPMILTDPAGLSPEAATTLTKLGITQVLVLGGNSAVSAATKSAITALGITVVQNFAGTNRADTAVQLAKWEIANLGFSPTAVALARGDGFADALAGAQVVAAPPAGLVAARASGSGPETLQLTDGPNEDDPVMDNFLADQKVTSIEVLGGTNSVTQTAVNTAVAAASGQSPPTGGWSVTGFSPGQSYLQGTAGQGFTLTGTFPGPVSSVSVIESSHNFDVGNPTEPGCNHSTAADQKIASGNTSTTITGLLVLPDDCPSGPYDVIVDGGLTSLHDAFTLLPAIVSISPTRLPADGNSHSLTIIGRSIRPTASFCLAPSSDHVNAGTPCASLAGAITGTLGTPGTTIFDVDFNIPTTSAGAWTVVVDSTGLRGAVGDCAACLQIGGTPISGGGLRTLTLNPTQPKLGDVVTVNYSGGTTNGGDEITLIDPANFSYGCMSGSGIAIAGDCTISLPTRAMTGLWTLSWSWSGTDGRASPCAAGLTYVAATGSLPFDCVLQFQITG